jgi:DNA-binding response OmpR family regulator
MIMVLIIDDDSRLTEPMQYQLEALGYMVAVAPDVTMQGPP